ncbi:MAG: hypothetical protein ACREGC_01785, partial [Minisyncoccia bacterium]
MVSRIGSNVLLAGGPNETKVETKRTDKTDPSTKTIAQIIQKILSQSPSNTTSTTTLSPCKMDFQRSTLITQPLT